MESLTINFATEFDADRVSPLLSDYLAYTYISDKHREFDKMLYEVKWFDYRCLNDLQATTLYAEAFETIHKRIYAQEFDYERASHIKHTAFRDVIRRLISGDAKMRRRFVGLWRGRQFADYYGMRYQDYIQHAITIRMRYWQQNCMPHPQQLYGAMILEKMPAKWEEMQQGRLYEAEHPAYLSENYADLRHQNDYHEYLFTQAYKRSNPPSMLAALINEGKLPYEKVKTRLDDYQFEMVERDLEYPN